MSLLYADTSAIVRAYFADEPDHDALRSMLLEGSEPVVSSELARIELASAVSAARRARRLRGADSVLARFDADCGSEGPILLLRLHAEAVLSTAYRLVGNHRLRTLDAIHLAVALEDAKALAGDDPLVFVTRDSDQAAAARTLGLSVR